MTKSIENEMIMGRVLIKEPKEKRTYTIGQVS
jgi:hypothetical protein